jgi:hypothetical protein
MTPQTDLAPADINGMIADHNERCRKIAESFESSARHLEHMLLRAISAPFKRKYKRQLARCRRDAATARASIIPVKLHSIN